MYPYIMSHRTQITLTNAQYERLLDESDRSGMSLSELVRRALDERYCPPQAEAMLDAIASAFGSWRGRDFDGEAYVDSVRRGLAERLESHDDSR
jgi:hypothetical protein